MRIPKMTSRFGTHDPRGIRFIILAAILIVVAFIFSDKMDGRPSTHHSTFGLRPSGLY